MRLKQTRLLMANMWKIIGTAPFDRNLELAVIDQEGTHALIFPCRQTSVGWINTETEVRVDVHPTHWRDWSVNVTA